MNEKNKHKVISPGTTERFEIDYHVPKQLVNPMSHGTISALMYYIEVDCDQGSCNYSNNLRGITYVCPVTPVCQEYIKSDPPKYWNPNLAPLVAYHKMASYSHQPIPEIVQYIQPVNEKSGGGYGIQPTFSVGTMNEMKQY